jgi:hypothetical protein
MSKWLQEAANFITIASFPFAPWSAFVCLGLGAIYLSADVWRAALYTQFPSGRILKLEREVYVLEHEIFISNRPFLGSKHCREFMNAIHMCVLPSRYSIFYSILIMLLMAYAVLKTTYLIARFATLILLDSAGLITSWRLCACTKTFTFMQSIHTRSRPIFRLVL